MIRKPARVCAHGRTHAGAVRVGDLISAEILPSSVNWNDVAPYALIGVILFAGMMFVITISKL